MLGTAASNGAQLALGGNVQGSTAVKLFLLFTVLSFASALVVSITSFTRIIIVLSFLRQALGTPSLPPNQVLTGLALFLTMFIMAPTAEQVYAQALGPLLDDKITIGQALERAEVPVRTFLLKQTNPEDVRLFYEVAGRVRPERGDVVPMTVLAPAYLISELSTAFKMGLYIFIPMLIIDILIASLLMSLGMMMVPPQMVSLPLKVGIFLLAGGWHLMVSSLVRSFG